MSGMQQCCEQKTQTRQQCKKVPYNVQEVITVPGKLSIISLISGYLRLCLYSGLMIEE